MTPWWRALQPEILQEVMRGMAQCKSAALVLTGDSSGMARTRLVNDDHIQVLVWTAYLGIGNGGDGMSTVIDALDVELDQRIEVLVTDGAIDIVATPSRPLTRLSVEHVPVLINVLKRAAEYAEADKHARETAWGGYES